MDSVLLRCSHGLGDSCSFQIVLKHARMKYPDCRLIAEIPKAQFPMFVNLVDEVTETHLPTLRYGHRAYHDIHFPRPNKCYYDTPSSKAARSCHDELRVRPIKDLFYYECPAISEETQDIADDFILSFDRPVVAVHANGVSRKELKDLTLYETKEICDMLLGRGYAPLLLDMSWSNPLIDNETVFTPRELYVNKQTDISLMAALLKRVHFVIGIDSGIEHLCGSIPETLCIICWKKLHPIHCYDLDRGNIHHLLPYNCADYVCDEGLEEGLQFFDENCHAEYYENIPSTIQDILDKLEQKNPLGQFLEGLGLA